MVKTGPYNALTDVAGIRVGHYTDAAAASGVTVALCPEGAVSGVDVRGSAPGTRETDLLDPVNLVDKVHAVVLSGGSVYGLAAADGAVRWLGQKGIGFPLEAGQVAPIVPAAVLYDLGRGPAFVPPVSAQWGRLACEAATAGPVAMGSVGAGTGAVSEALKGGLGTASAVLDCGLTVAALVAVNSHGSVIAPGTGRPWEIGLEVAAEFGEQGRRAVRLPPPPPGFPARNTTIGLVASDAVLTKAQATKIAQMAHDGMARAIRPAHTMFDGDTLFCLATGTRPLPATEGLFAAPQARALSELGHAAADCVARAVIHAVLSARGMPGQPAIRGRQVGGRLHVWARLAVRMSPGDLADSAPEGGEGFAWPVSYAELAPFYDQVETLLGLTGSRAGLPGLPDGRFVASRGLTDRELRFRRAVEARWPERRVLESPLVVYRRERMPVALSMALGTGRLALRPGAVAARVTVDGETAKANGVEFVDRVSRVRARARGRLVILCASAFESVRLLLNSACAQHPRGIGGSTGVLGRYIMDHVLVIRSGRLQCRAPDAAPENADPYDFGAAHGFYIPHVAPEDDPVCAGSPRLGIAGAVGREGPLWWLMATGAARPRAVNRLSVTPGRPDAWGIPSASIDFRWSDHERRLALNAGRILDELAEAAGLPCSKPWWDAPVFAPLLKAVWAERGVFHPGLSVHELGGAPMGAFPSRSVLDPLNRCWDAANVLVADGACFPRAGYQNPTLTIMALSARAAANAAADFDEVAL